MKKGKRFKISISAKIAAITILAISVIGLILLISIAFSNKNTLPVLGDPGHIAGSFSFTNQEGRQISEKTVADKVTLVEYFFTSCPSICPVMNENLKGLFEKFKGDTRFVILSHTVDPERDSVSVLNKYAKRYGATAPGWEFLTGDKNALYTSASRDYLLAAVDSGNSSFIHTQYVALLDKKRRIRGFYDATNKENIPKLESDIVQLLND
ncbi:MAG TPA: SCO family protein [Puia sp.]|nr:SCO family protein [Puia sp.]